MVLTVHHLSVSQSERIPWLLEELGLPYQLHVYKRQPADALAPPELKNLPGNPMHTAPVFHDSDGDITLAESGAIIDYVLARYGNGRLAPEVKDTKTFAQYLDWLHRSNASVLPGAAGGFYLNMAGVAADAPIRQRLNARFTSQLKYAEDTLKKSTWLAGDQFTAADIMNHFVFTNARFFMDFSLKGYPNILRWAGDCAKRPAFQEAFKKGDPEILPFQPLGEDPPTEEQKVWKKK